MTNFMVINFFITTFFYKKFGVTGQIAIYLYSK
jgi:hypothetical protein